MGRREKAKVDVLRTPKSCFEGLQDFPFAENYCEVSDPSLGNLRVHYVDEGARGGDVILCMHGEPTWSYLYRNMIPVFADAGFRVVAPDLIGFGKSDKPQSRDAYTYANHVRWMLEWLMILDLTRITLVCQDWGGLIGLRLATALHGRFDRIAAANTFLPTGDTAPSDAFFRWREFSQDVPEFPAGGIVKGATVRDLTDQEIAAYNAPFPEERYKSGAREFPMIVPTTPDDPEADANRMAWEVLGRWEKPFLTCFSDQDPVTSGGDGGFQRRVPGCGGQPHVTLSGGHFIQEDAGVEWAENVVRWIAAERRD